MNFEEVAAILASDQGMIMYLNRSLNERAISELGGARKGGDTTGGATTGRDQRSSLGLLSRA